MSAQQQNEIQDVLGLLLVSAKIEFKYRHIDNLIQSLKKFYRFAEWKKVSSYGQQFADFSSLLNKKKFNYDTDLKVKLGSFDFVISYGEVDRLLSADVYVFIYPSMDIINILYNISFGDLSIDELIYLRKVIQFRKIEDKVVKMLNCGFLKDYPEVLFTDFREISEYIYRPFIKISGYTKYRLRLRYLFSNIGKFNFQINEDRYMKSVFSKINIERLMLIEIRNYTGMKNIDISSDEFCAKYARKLYGMLVCDEGYEYVPLQSAISSLKDNFSSREFFSVFASNVGVLFINLVNSNLQYQYQALQNQLACCFEDKCSKTLCTHPDIAGLEHGSLFAMEQVTNLLLIINSNMKKDYYMNRHIKKIIKNRSKLLEIINISMSININEITKLTNLIMDKFGIYAYIMRVRERLDIAENDALVVYQRRNNVLILIITIISVIFAAMSISEIKSTILAFLPI